MNSGDSIAGIKLFAGKKKLGGTKMQCIRRKADGDFETLLTKQCSW